jgi:hypothetical protein
MLWSNSVSIWWMTSRRYKWSHDLIYDFWQILYWKPCVSVFSSISVSTVLLIIYTWLSLNFVISFWSKIFIFLSPKMCLSFITQICGAVNSDNTIIATLKTLCSVFWRRAWPLVGQSGTAQLIQLRLCAFQLLDEFLLASDWSQL